MPDAEQVQNQFAEDVDKTLGLEIQDPGNHRKKPKPEKGCAQVFWVPTAIAVLVALLLAFWVYSAVLPKPSATPSGTSATQGSGQAGAVGGATAGSAGNTQQAGTLPRRWLIVADTPLHGKRPQFTIELKGEGQSGDAVWLEPPQGTGTYEWSGEDLVVKLVLAQTYTPGKTFPQQFEIRMKKLPDGSLSGQLLSENWAYSADAGLKRNGMVSWPAVGEPK